MWGASHAGRTGRFGRKGISINFVHDKATWQQMEQIERQTGKQIIRIETNDLDEMEEVRLFLCFPDPSLSRVVRQREEMGAAPPPRTSISLARAVAGGNLRR